MHCDQNEKLEANIVDSDEHNANLCTQSKRDVLLLHAPLCSVTQCCVMRIGMTWRVVV